VIKITKVAILTPLLLEIFGLKRKTLDVLIEKIEEIVLLMAT
jgi:hypothetical protein